MEKEVAKEREKKHPGCIGVVDHRRRRRRRRHLRNESARRGEGREEEKRRGIPGVAGDADATAQPLLLKRQQPPPLPQLPVGRSPGNRF